jgi:PAS domain S-box-containing protein
MALISTHLTGVERTFGDEEIIVTKTDTRGRITYANDVFLRLAGYSEDEVLGRAHNLIRHPAMPKSVFKLLWDTIESGREIFAYVVNRSKNGDHYWVFAHVTPTFDANGTIIGYHSNRRSPERKAIQAIEPIYAALLEIESRHGSDWRAGMDAAVAHLMMTLDSVGKPYDEFVFSI